EGGALTVAPDSLTPDSLLGEEYEPWWQRVPPDSGTVALPRPRGDTTSTDDWSRADSTAVRPRRGRDERRERDGRRDDDERDRRRPRLLGRPGPPVPPPA